MNRNERMELARQTVQITEAGAYQAPDGSRVDIADQVAKSVQRTTLIRPADWSEIITVGRAAPNLPASAQIEVTGETTLAAARRLVEAGCQSILALNFASAKNPGGGFLGGSQAQEESLARSSALYASLIACGEYYEQNRRCHSLLYTDHAIHTPDVPVFRDDDGRLLPAPYLISFLTMPAPNVGAMKADDADIQRVPDVLRQRVEYVLALAAARAHRELILGAWGCGVFGNDPSAVANIMHERLFADDGWARKFNRIIFAVFDRTPGTPTLAAFQKVLTATPSA